MNETTHSMNVDKVEWLAIQRKYDESGKAIEKREINGIYSFCLPNCTFETDDGDVSDTEKSLSWWRMIFENARDLRSQEVVLALNLNENEARVTSKCQITGWIEPSKVFYGKRWPFTWLLSIPLTDTSTNRSFWTKTEVGWFCKSVKYGRSRFRFGFLPLKF